MRGVTSHACNHVLPKRASQPAAAVSQLGRPVTSVLQQFCSSVVDWPACIIRPVQRTLTCTTSDTFIIHSINSEIQYVSMFFCTCETLPELWRLSSLTHHSQQQQSSSSGRIMQSAMRSKLAEACNQERRDVCNQESNESCAPPFLIALITQLKFGSESVHYFCRA